MQEIVSDSSVARLIQAINDPGTQALALAKAKQWCESLKLTTAQRIQLDMAIRSVEPPRPPNLIVV
ncbi:hypothetical protein WP8S17C03_30630 [Metapseudomonas otitidis]|uniref:Uncharacterized protein n=1 Tax=Metapseudomonas otitidis TaxID=319939 RepID=A0A6S5RVJ6_9GAMM|nr:hypothetical protein [Pseudomonas otitidis]BBT17014.1 hypothetical protein WP8S17C03_30630 [Pseudomonas otitidis]